MGSEFKAQVRLVERPYPRSASMMKAVRFSQFGGPEVLEIVDLPDPHYQPDVLAAAARAVGPEACDVPINQRSARLSVASRVRRVTIQFEIARCRWRSWRPPAWGTNVCG